MTNLLNKKGYLVALSLLCSGLVTAACSTEGAHDSATTTDENSGTLGLNLTLSNGSVLNAVEATISGDALSADLVRTINVGNDGATVSALFGGLPTGDYSITLAGESEEGDVSCSGSANFTIMAGQTVGVTVPLSCTSDVLRGSVGVNGEIDFCPTIDGLFVGPLQTGVGNDIIVEASATDAVTWEWAATAGSFDDPAAPNTTYNCDVAGDQVLTLKISDDAGCVEEASIDIRCEPLDGVECGNGEVEMGEECDPPQENVCSDTCQNIDPIECGNSEVEEGEECDPPNGETCNSSCQDIECGDGVVEGNEECDPPVADVCSATCEFEEVCGNGQVEEGEECDPPNGETCNDSCLDIECGDGIVEGNEECDPPEEGVCSATCEDEEDPCPSCLEESCPDPLALVADLCADGSCDEYMACIADTACDGGDDPDIRKCYCGDTPFTTCFNSFSTVTGNGPCLAETEALAGSTVPLQIGTLYFDTTSPLGAVNQRSLCTANECADVCY